MSLGVAGGDDESVDGKERIGVSSGYANCMFAGRWRTLILTLGRLARSVRRRDASLWLCLHLCYFVTVNGLMQSRPESKVDPVEFLEVIKELENEGVVKVVGERQSVYSNLEDDY